MEKILFQEKFPIIKHTIDKTKISFEEIIKQLKKNIEQNPVSKLIEIFDHFSHTKSLNGEIKNDIIKAQNLLFCFGAKLNDPLVLSVRPRSIGVVETKSEFIISFMETPNEGMTKILEKWILGL